AYPSSNFRRGRVGKQVAQTLVTGNSLGVVTNQLRIRKLTPRECFRLQGFPDWAFNRASSVSSNSQLYKQAGNAVTVPVVYEIGKRLAAIEKEGKAVENHESC
ncbi:TPA: DNA cytosine methyltransferase, partial [Streptococcus suis]|nr:DNA cytosine methyltransferase [Streptococcus suis]